MKTTLVATALLCLIAVAMTTQAQNLKPFKDFDNLSLYGFKDIKGNIIVVGKYNYANEFSEGLALVSRASGYDDWGNEYYSWGFIDQTGEEVIPLKYKHAMSFYTLKIGRAHV